MKLLLLHPPLLSAVVFHQAHQRGWRTKHLPGLHLDPLTRPAAVAAALLPMLDSD